MRKEEWLNSQLQFLVKISVYLKLDVTELTRHLHVDMTLGPELC